MNSKVRRPVPKNRTFKYDYINKLIYKSIFVLVFLLVILAMKKINAKPTNSALVILQKNLDYKFNLVEDSKRVFKKAQNLLDSSLETVGVFKETNETIVLPIAGTIHKDFNQKITINGISSKNNGLDIKSNSEKDPQSIGPGVVTRVEQKGNKGYFVTIKKDNMETIYGYLSKPYVSEGSNIETGDFIGSLGLNKDGSKYLRLEVYIDGIPVDPMDYLDI